jgi:hypothetical protein
VTDDASAIRGRATEVLEAGHLLRVTSIDERARWLADAAQRLLRMANRASGALSEATGLSIPMVQWATRTTLGTLREDTMLLLSRQALDPHQREPNPIAMLSVVLAGNLFTASVRAITVPLLFGVPVLVKASSRETMFPAMLRSALRAADSHLGAAMDLVAFRGGDVRCEAAFAESSEAVSIYGTDATIAAMSTRLRDTRLLRHGHGVSVAYCGRTGLEDARIGNTIAALSLDICAYDQRGCLSPQIVYVQDSPLLPTAEFARRLASEGMDPMSRTLPRGPLPASIGATQTQWRGVAEVEGTLIHGDAHAIAIRSARPIRWSPAYRNVSLIPVEGLDEAFGEMESLGPTLKCVGADRDSLTEIQTRLDRSDALAAYACAMGTMQTPPLDAPADGHPIWHGLFRAQTPMKSR